MDAAEAGALQFPHQAGRFRSSQSRAEPAARCFDLMRPTEILDDARFSSCFCSASAIRSAIRNFLFTLPSTARRRPAILPEEPDIELLLLDINMPVVDVLI